LSSGANSLHKDWFKTDRAFDVFTVDYSTNGQLADIGSEYYLNKQGPKWHLVAAALEKLQEQAGTYEYVWCPDDDLFIQPKHIDRFFDLMKALSLEIAQPALTRGSYISHPITKQIPLLEYRLTNFVEIMAPALKMDFLMSVREKLTRNLSGWGVDFYFQAVAKKKGWRMGIIDAVPVAHVRPTNAPPLKPDPTIKTSASFYTEYEINPWNEIREFLQEENIEREKAVVYRGYFPKSIPAPKHYYKLIKKYAKKYE
jgi:hypothetical protein